MSKWDWIHAGLEIATFAKAQNAEQQLLAMKTASEIEAARRVYVEAMRNFIFEISRDIQLAEEQIGEFPQQVYIVSKCLEQRLIISNLSADAFPDLQDKEYFFKTQKKVSEVTGISRVRLTEQQIQTSDIAIKYISDLPLLQKAIISTSARESLTATSSEWKRLESEKTNKKLLTGLGTFGMIGSACGGIIALVSESSSAIVALLILIGAGVLFAIGNKSNPEHKLLKTQREEWQKQLVEGDEWSKIISTLGNLDSNSYKRVYQDRLAYLKPLLGGDFQKFLTAG